MIRVMLIHPSDPLAVKAGGEEAFIRGFVKHAPDDFRIEQIGITTDPRARPIGRWSDLRIGPTGLRHLPVCFDRDVNAKTRIPLSLRFTWSLARRRVDVRGRILLFNRIEPACLFKSAGCPMIGFVHNDIQRRIAAGSDSTWRHVRPFYFRFERRVFFSFDHVYAVSRRTLEFYRDRYPFLTGHVEFLPTWVDTEIFRPPTPACGARSRIAAEFAVPASCPWILYVGRLQEQKAPLRLVETLHELRRTHTDAQLLILGDGNLRKRLVARARQLAVAGAVHFLGFHSPERLVDFYGAADAFLLTSNFEGMPRACLEALACALPVVSTNAGEVKSVVRPGESGEVVETPAPADLADALRKVLDDPELYTPARCTASVAAFTPRRVLEPVYARCRALAG